MATGPRLKCCSNPAAAQGGTGAAHAAVAAGAGHTVCGGPLLQPAAARAHGTGFVIAVGFVCLLLLPPFDVLCGLRLLLCPSILWLLCSAVALPPLVSDPLPRRPLQGAEWEVSCACWCRMPSSRDSRVVKMWHLQTAGRLGPAAPLPLHATAQALRSTLHPQV